MTAEKSTSQKSSPKKTIVGIVRLYLANKYERGEIEKAAFSDVQKKVMAAFPDCRFNPSMFSCYKSRFLASLGCTRMYKERVVR